MLNMLSYKSLIFLLLVSDVTFGGFLNVDMKKCPKRNGLFPKIGSYCKSYYKCTNWVPMEITCPEDELFNPIAGWCDWIEAFTCLDKPKRKECPRENGNFLKPQTKCKKYYACCNGEPTEMTCPSDTLFDPSNEKCEWPELYTCIEEPNRKECPKDNGYFLKTGTDCQQYYHCIKGKPTVKNCPKGQIFDPSQGRCEWMELYTCVESISTKDIISSTFNPLTSSTNENRPSISTETTNYETTPYPEVSSPETSFDPYTQSSTSDVSTDSTNYETSPYPEVSSPETSFDPYTQSSTSDVSTDSTNYETSPYPEVSSPETSFDPNTQSSTDDMWIFTDTTKYETSAYPDVSSSETTFDPNSLSSTDDVSLSSLYTDSTGYETSHYPDGSSLRTASNLENQHTEEGKSSSSFTDTPDYKTSQYPSSSSYRTSYPYTRSSLSELSESTIEPYESTTFQPYTKSSSVFVEETSEPVDIWCPAPSGYFPHPTDKHKFVACIDGKPTVMDCPSNLVYNKKAKRCDYK